MLTVSLEGALRDLFEQPRTAHSLVDVYVVISQKLHRGDLFEVVPVESYLLVFLVEANLGIYVAKGG